MQQAHMGIRMNAKRLLTVILTLLMIATALTSIPQTAYAQPGEDWIYSKSIIVQENSGDDLSNYQILVELNSTNFNFSQANSDGSDLRFFAESQELSYWIEEWNFATEHAKIWVRIPSIPASSEVQLTMLFGNPAASSTSNGDTTFELFDDFNGSNINDTKWTVVVGATGGYSEVQNGAVKLFSPNASSDDFCAIYSKSIFDINTMFVAKRMKVTTGPDSRGPEQYQLFVNYLLPGGWIKISHGTEFRNESWVFWDIINDGNRYNPYRDWTDVGVSEGSWYTSGVAWYEDNGVRQVAWFKNGIRDTNMDYSSNDYIPNTPLSVFLESASYSIDSSDNTGYMAVDYAFVRQFFGQDPLVTVGPEPNTPTGSPVAVSLSCADVIFSNITVAGTTTCTSSTGNPGGPTPPNFRVRGFFIDITTTAFYSGPVTVCIPYDPSIPNPQNLKLFHWNAPNWEDVTTSIDPATNTICGQVSGLSPFFLGEEVAQTGGGGCFIATAAYGSSLDSHVDTLRSFRDQYLETNPLGSAFVSLYYKVSPPMAEFIDAHPGLKPLVRFALQPAIVFSSVAINTTPMEKIAIALVILTLLFVMRERKRQRKAR